ncbi:FliA/WhiG family RNA polymerase sigma factor [Vogesella sp. LIG4]|uniref:FliA/WhiG family RNA polymerase sigma factor n=1 Tax=Vogesella sp. LIG4 TaxID=1192162 RepID=UPI00081FCC20|nr:FliA/WhiG family RNA polymerase sigma factor [Vogesella sp. LIG4]SCK17549.1 RNA polymerase sigma factor for flagellar operon FliA [Vogesella sp. LIG4]
MALVMEYACMQPPAGAVAERQVLCDYAPLVKRVVRQLSSQVGGAMDREDMEQIGLMGLLDALRRYGGVPDERFGAYAGLRVRGAILDELRRQDWRPRTVRQEAHRSRDALRELSRKLGREPNEAEASAALGMDVAAYQEYLLAENAETLASFDELMHDEALQQVGGSVEAQYMDRRSLEQALLALDAREQRVIQLYYEFELSLKEIAAVLELTEARVCQINKAALKKMRAVLADA